VREERVIALAGMLQAAGLVRNLAVRGQLDAPSMRTSLASVFKVDADNAADVFGGVPNLRYGLETLVAQVESGQRDTGLTRLLINIMRLERVLAGRSDILLAVRNGIATIGHDPADADFNEAIPRLAQLYASTLSTLRPRILVEGTPRFIADPANVDRIRAMLLAAIRSSVLWRQLGGSNWRLFFRHRQYAMMARGLLAQCTLSGS
jgi:high frequency lysogenization protein